MTTIYLRDKDVAERYAISRSTVWRWVHRGLLPAPVELSESCTRWKLEEIEQRDAEREASAA